MKKTRSTFLPLLTAFAIAFLANCSGKNGEHAHDAHETAEVPPATEAQQPGKPQFTVDNAFQKQLSDIFTAYVDLKNALVSAEVSQVKEEAKSMESSLSKADLQWLRGAARSDWSGYVTSLQSSLKDIQAGDDIDAQRKAFSTLSEDLYKSIRAFGLGGDEAFYEYCPMAFDNEGAYWLSESEEIRNPYFGDKMLKCGEVREKLQ